MTAPTAPARPTQTNRMTPPWVRSPGRSYQRFQPRLSASPIAVDRRVSRPFDLEVVSVHGADDLDATFEPARGGETRVRREQCRIERFGERDVQRIPRPHRVAQVPCAGEERAVPVSLAGPRAKVVDGLSC